MADLNLPAVDQTLKESMQLDYNRLTQLFMKCFSVLGLTQWVNFLMFFHFVIL